MAVLGASGNRGSILAEKDKRIETLTRTVKEQETTIAELRTQLANGAGPSSSQLEDIRASITEVLGAMDKSTRQFKRAARAVNVSGPEDPLQIAACAERIAAAIASPAAE